ncbi:unnamed protein product [Thelazia callipaeda]|uniref:Tubulin-specific chaperone A n=1 Tax=Thelazia callipaeda TaxID=103827 RepID=A0A0N5D6Y8_THECL|nr:unnamed protein product [Thelazia callipaeda]
MDGDTELSQDMAVEDRNSKTNELRRFILNFLYRRLQLNLLRLKVDSKCHIVSTKECAETRAQMRKSEAGVANKLSVLNNKLKAIEEKSKDENETYDASELEYVERIKTETEEKGTEIATVETEISKFIEM